MMNDKGRTNNEHVVHKNIYQQEFIV